MLRISSRRVNRVALAGARVALVSSAVAAGLGCSAPDSSPPPRPAGEISSGGGSTSEDAGPVAIPFVVSDEFVPSGFMGDSPTDFNAIKMSSTSSLCPARQSGAKGACYSITWTPSVVTGAKSAWVGVYWQYPSNNWGAKAGRSIVAGASKVTFFAEGAAGGEQVEFLVGGVNVSGGTAGLSFADSFTAKTDATLTTSWAPYEVSLAGTSYSSVIGGFAWSITTSSTAPITFYIDDVEWE